MVTENAIAERESLCQSANVYTWTKYKGYDPEVGNLWGNALYNGIDYGRYPSPRIYTFGLNVSF